MRGVYYNEWDAFAADWLRNLIRAGKLPAGDVDERSIVDVSASDLVGYGQVHLFAGIGGWPLALRLAGVPDEEPVWTGSCPCQPFSVAGAGKGEADERHVWPEFRRLIAECRPELVFGEQVDSTDGTLWLAGVHLDLEALAYSFGAAVLPAAGVGAPHQRHRIYWMAHAGTSRWEGTSRGRDSAARSVALLAAEPTSGLAEPSIEGVGGLPVQPGRPRQADANTHGRGEDGGLGDTLSERGCGGDALGEHADDAHAPGEVHPCWREFTLVPCGDGKLRRIEPRTPPVAARVPGRVGQLRAYGNAISPPLASEFIRAALWRPRVNRSKAEQLAHLTHVGQEPATPASTCGWAHLYDCARCGGRRVRIIHECEGGER